MVIKQLRKRKQNKNGIRAFMKETELLKKLSHPSIPTYVDSFSHLGTYYLVMRKMDGNSLELQLFEQGRSFTKLESYVLVRDLLTITSYLHKQGIVHRDLRPPNIMVNGNSLSVIDFGLARYIGDSTKKKRKSPMRETHPRGDFYAIGHTLLFLLYSGFTPQSSKKRSWDEELTLSNEETRFIRKLLQIDEPFQDDNEVFHTLVSVIEHLENQPNDVPYLG